MLNWTRFFLTLLHDWVMTPRAGNHRLSSWFLNWRRIRYPGQREDAPGFGENLERPGLRRAVSLGRVVRVFDGGVRSIPYGTDITWFLGPIDGNVPPPF